MQAMHTAHDVTFRDEVSTPLAIIERCGDPATIGATIQRFIAWRSAIGLPPKSATTLDVFH